ncbi:MAG: M23 family metallopeptidase [Pseudomonadota bacterium]
MNLRFRRLVLAVFLAYGMYASGHFQIAAADPADAFECGGALSQGGLLICRSEPGDVISANDYRVEVPSSGIITLGLSRNAPDKLSVKLIRTGEEVATYDFSITPRNDPTRIVSGLDCDKVDARSDAQKAHAGRSWQKKVAAFAVFEFADAFPKRFERPSEGRISSPFGPVRTYRGVSAETGEPCSRESVHRGYDIAAPIGTPIRAPAPGTVLLAEDDLYYEGGTVFLDHGFGLVSVFIHMSSVEVSAGDRVDTSTLLGAVGNTGRTTGPHLHWAVKWRNIVSSDRSADFYIDPGLLLDLDLTEFSPSPTY